MPISSRNFQCLFRTGKCPPVSQLKYVDQQGNIFRKNERNGEHLSSSMRLSEKIRDSIYIPNSSRLEYYDARKTIPPPQNKF